MYQPRRWVIVFVMYFAGLVTSLSQFKVAPLTHILMEQLQINEATVGLLISLFSLISLILVFPGTAILFKIGPLKCGLLSIGCLIAGSAAGCLSGSIPVLLASRVLEGAGMALIGVVGSTVIALYFKPDENSLPMGLWSTWYPAGAGCGLIFSAVVADYFEIWKSSWYFSMILACIAFVLFAVFVRVPKPKFSESSGSSTKIAIEHKALPSVISGFKNIKIWLLGLTLCIFMIGNTGFMSFVTQYSIEVLNMEPSAAGGLSSLGFFASVPGGILAGLVLKRSTPRKNSIAIIACSILAAAIFPVGFCCPPYLLVPYLLVMAAVTVFGYAAILVTVPGITVHPMLIGSGMSIVFFGQTLGGAVGGSFVGALLAANGWSGTVMPIFLIQCLGIVFSIVASLLIGRCSGSCIARVRE